MATALGIAPDGSGKGVDPLTHRRIIAAQWDNPGIIAGLTVAGAGLAYTVAAGAAVCSRSEVDGCSIAYWEGGSTPAVAAGDPSNPRIDVVYLVAHDIGQGDPDNQVKVGVLSGAAAVSPVAPSLSSVPGAVKLQSWLVPAGAASMTSAQKTGNNDYALPYGASKGVLARLSENIDGAVSSSASPFVATSLYFPTDRNVELKAFLCVSGNSSGVAAARFIVDGVLYATRKIAYGTAWVTYEPSTTVTMEAGNHTFGLAMLNQSGGGFDAHFGVRDGDNYPGRMLRITDLGPAQ